MRTSQLLNRAICSLTILLGVACDHTAPLSFEPAEGVTSAGEVSISYLKSLCTGSSRRITEDFTICGCVTANDCRGEWYKAIVIEDASGAVEVELDDYALYRRFPIYATVRIACNGLALGRTGGKIELGAPPTGDYTVDRIAYSDIGQHLARLNKESDITPVTFDRLDLFTAADISTTVVVRNVRLAADSSGNSWCDTDDKGAYVTTERQICDAAGNTLRVRTLGSCDYASEGVPQGEFTIGGIVEYSTGGYLIRISNHLIIQ